jgi:hypothetical protein
MMAPDPNEVHTLIQNALDALKRGDKRAARSLAKYAASLAPETETPWLILATLASTEEALAYIKKALQINPESKPAQQALEWALKKQHDRSTAPRPQETDLKSRLNISAETLPEPDPHRGPVHMPASSAVSDEALPKPEPALEPIPLHTTPGTPPETLPEPEPPSEPIHPPASRAVLAQALPIPEPLAEPIHPHTAAAVPAETPSMPEPPSEIIRPSVRPVNRADVSQGADRSNPPATGKKIFSLSPARILVLSLLGLLVVALIAGAIFLRPQLTGLLARFFPGEGCSPSLVLGTRSFEIRTLKPGSDGSLDVPANRPNTAYWIEGTDVNYVFGLSPTPENLALETSLAAGEQATVTWPNCNSSSHTLTASQAGVPDRNTLLDQSFSGITIFVQGDNGFVIHGELASEEILTFNTPDPSSIQAEISLLETIPSADKTTVTVKVSIANYGQDSITLTPNDVSLAVRDSNVAPLGSEPTLPKEIAPGAAETFAFTFGYPPELGATLNVYGAEYELDY